MRGIIPRWADKNAYVNGDIIHRTESGFGKHFFICKSNVGHVSSPSTEPEVGADWENEWDLLAGYGGGSL